MNKSQRVWIALAVVGVGSGLAWSRQDAKPEPPAGAAPAAVEPYQRVVDDDDGAVKLEMAVREFAPAQPGKPRIYLAGAVHIGDESFYRSLQQFLDMQDVVLFEGVKPPGSGAAEHEAAPETDDAKAAATKRRVRFLAMAVERYRSGHDGNLPASVNELVSGSEGRVGALLKGSLDDAWGHPLIYTLAQEAAPDSPDRRGGRGFDVESLGADGQEGGEGAAADIRYSDQKPLSKPETGDRSEGIQQKLADATGWVFQLNAMDNNKGNWRNSDLSVDQVQSRLEKAGANADALFSAINGSSFVGRVMGWALGILASSPDSRAMLRIMLIETIGAADIGSIKMPGKLSAMMDVLLEDRNSVVIDDLKRLIEREPGVKSIAIIYGAGHLPSMQKRIVSELGYSPIGDTWRTAMSVDAAKAGLNPAQVTQMREMIKRMIAAQTKKKPAPAGP